jgi:hypothetical protein
MPEDSRIGREWKIAAVEGLTDHEWIQTASVIGRNLISEQNSSTARSSWRELVPVPTVRIRSELLSARECQAAHLRRRGC